MSASCCTSLQDVTISRATCTARQSHCSKVLISKFLNQRATEYMHICQYLLCIYLKACNRLLNCCQGTYSDLNVWSVECLNKLEISYHIFINILEKKRRTSCLLPKVERLKRLQRTVSLMAEYWSSNTLISDFASAIYSLP